MASEVVSKYLFITFENRKTAEIDAVENFGFFYMISTTVN